jgi:hypothetical protein
LLDDELGDIDGCLANRRAALLLTDQRLAFNTIELKNRWIDVTLLASVLLYRPRR